MLRSLPAASPSPRRGGILFSSVKGRPQILLTQSAWRRVRVRAENKGTDTEGLPQASWHTLPDGMRLEKIEMPSSSSSGSYPPLLFVHGSYHGAWCWTELFGPYFSNLGYNVVAISLRGQGNSDKGDLKVAGTLQSHVDDLASVIASFDRPPVVVAHSFGGLLLEAYCSLQQNMGNRPKIAGACLVAAVPPAGNKEIITRITKKSLLKSMRITWGFISKSFRKDADACRELFFSEDLAEDRLLEYQAKLAQCSDVALLDVRKLSSQVPLPPLDESIFVDGSIRAFVGGGTNDCVVDPPAVAEAAAYYGVTPVLWDNMAHDVMLDTRWEHVAEDIDTWMKESFSVTHT